MKNISNLFFLTGAICAVLGMVWGIEMSISTDHSLSPAHGHLNLIGFVTMSIFGAYYALNPEVGTSKLARLHYGLTLVATIIIVPGIVMAINETGEALAKAGSLLMLLAMAQFCFMIFKQMRQQSKE